MNSWLPVTDGMGSYLNELIGNRRLRLVGAAQFFSRTASAALLVALTWYATKAAGAEGAAIALTALAIGRGLATLLGGALADRLSKTGLITFTELSRATTLLVVVALSVGSTAVPAVAWSALAGIVGVLSGISSPAASTIVIECVEPDQLANALSLVQLLIQAGTFLGPAVGGVLIATADATTALVVLSVCYLFAASAIFFADVHPRVAARPGHPMAGLAFVAKHLDILVLALAALASNALSAPLDVLLAVYFKGSSANYGLAVSMWGVGMVAGAGFVASRPFTLMFRVRLAWVGIIGLGLLEALMGVAPVGVAPVVLMGAVGLATGPVSASLLAYVLHVVPGEIRGRVIAATQASSMAVTPLAFALTGLLATELSVRALMDLGGLGLLAVAGALYVLFQNRAGGQASEFRP